MADRSNHPGSREHPGDNARTPRWVKVFAIAAAAVVLLIVLVMFLGGGEHGPGRHTSSGLTGGNPPSNITAADIAHPLGGHECS